MVPSCLFIMNTCPSGPAPMRRSTRAAAFLALLAILLLDELEQRLSYAIAEEQNAADGRLSTTGQIVGVEIKDLSAGQVAPQHAIGQLWDGASAVHVNTGGRGPSLQERVAVVVLG